MKYYSNLFDSNFGIILSNNKYIDKTFLIKEILFSKHQNIYLCSPYGSGKSLFISTLIAFLDRNYIFPLNKLSISDYASIKKSIANRGITITVNFERCRASTLVDCKLKIFFMFSSIYNNLLLYLNITKFNHLEKLFFYKIAEEDPEDFDYFQFLPTLISIIYKQIQCPIYILVDGLDSLFFKAANCSYYPELSSFLRTMISQIVLQNIHSKLIITSIFSLPLNSFIYDSILKFTFNTKLTFNKLDFIEYLKKTKVPNHVLTAEKSNLLTPILKSVSVLPLLAIEKIERTTPMHYTYEYILFFARSYGEMILEIISTIDKNGYYIMNDNFKLYIPTYDFLLQIHSTDELALCLVYFGLFSIIELNRNRYITIPNDEIKRKLLSFIKCD